MGENKHIEELDAFAKKYVKEIATNEPSSNFTSNIMDAILTEENKALYQNNAKLSSSIWFVLGGFILALISLLIFGKSSNLQLPSFDFVNFSEFSFHISVSDITVYAFFCLAVLFFIQGYFMKNYFEKQFK